MKDIILKVTITIHTEGSVITLSIININHLTKDYGNRKGVFDVSIQIQEGEVYGYLGPNGAGKSTTMRHLMGFCKPQSGSVHILGMDCWSEQKKIQKSLGYLPGEISFPDDMTGWAYLKLIGKMRGMKSFSYAHELLDFFEINPDTGIKRMSKGMKQKIAIVSAFMHEPEVLLLDEPTSGLDPLMQNRFIALVEQAKSKGKTVILSSHLFEEVEKTCDRVGMIRNGKLIKEFTDEELQHSKVQTYQIVFEKLSDLQRMRERYPESSCDEEARQLTVSINDSQINDLISQLSAYRLCSLKEKKHTLEDYFMQFYGGGQDD